MNLKTSHGHHKFSEDISSQLTTFGDIKGTLKCFVGDFSVLSDDAEWEGDEVVLETSNSSIKILYEDEPGELLRSKSGFFGRLLGL